MRTDSCARKEVVQRAPSLLSRDHRSSLPAERGGFVSQEEQTPFSNKPVFLDLFHDFAYERGELFLRVYGQPLPGQGISEN